MESTGTESAKQDGLARKFETLILQRLASVGQRPVADALNTSESTISRMKESDIRRFCQMLAVLGVKCVPADVRCFNPKDVEVLLHGHRRWTEHLQSIEQLWDDE